MTRLEHYLQHLQRFGIQPGLERIRALLESAGNPQNDYPIILVGGTNGKGSTCEFAARLLAQNNRRIGLYTSPHLYHWNERIRILPGAISPGAGLFEGAISDADLDALFEAAQPHIESVARPLGQPTEFEVMTFLGFWHFARQNVDAAVIEVGLGGKWDATNVCDPLVSVVTHVALDHMDRLGNTLEEIAADKVRIARGGRPFLTLESKPNVASVLESYCQKIGAQFQKFQPLFSDDFHQINFNFAQKIVACFGDVLGWQLELAPRFPIQVRGRFEQISAAPRVIIDGANNPEGAAQLVDQLNHDWPSHRDLILVLGILADKKWEQMTQTLAGEAEIVIATQSLSPRAAPACQIAEIARQFCANVEEITPVAAAVERARALAKPEDTILVTGSFTTIAEVPRDSF